MKQPLHIPHSFDRRLMATGSSMLKTQLRARAENAFVMHQLGAALARKSTTSRAAANGFREGGRADQLDITYAEQCMVHAGMMPKPKYKPTEKRAKRLREDKLHRAKAKTDPTRGLTNYECGKYMLALRRARHEGVDAQLLASTFKGCRQWGS